MADNPVVTMLGRRLRLAVIGGGPGSSLALSTTRRPVSTTVMSRWPLPSLQTRNCPGPPGWVSVSRPIAPMAAPWS